MCIYHIVKSPTYKNHLLHMSSNNNSIKHIDNNKICGRSENTGEGLLLTIGSAECVKTQVRCKNTGKHTGHNCKTFLPVFIVVNRTEHGLYGNLDEIKCLRRYKLLL